MAPHVGRESPKGVILVVEDADDIRALMRVRLERRGHTVVEARNGLEALEVVRARAVDLILLDIMMPELNGFDVLRALKANSEWQHIPVVVLSALDDTEHVVQCIRLGADDYLVKPFKSVLLYARVDNLLERKHLRDREQEILRALQEEQRRTEQLLRSIFPQAIAERLKSGFAGIIAEQYEMASVLFADIVDFTRRAAQMEAEEVVSFLGDVFAQFEKLTAAFGVEKIKTIGDAFMAAAGVPEPTPRHAEQLLRLAFAMRQSVANMRWPDGSPVHLRVGLASGPVAAGVLGTSRFSYDVWGNTVNMASRLQELALPNTVLVDEVTWRLVEHLAIGAPRVERVKGKGNMTVYEVEPRYGQAAVREGGVT